MPVLHCRPRGGGVTVDEQRHESGHEHGAGYEHGRFSHWRDTAEIDEAQARQLAARLELRAQGEDQIEARAAYLELLGVGPGDRVLDVGCGSGAILRDLARRVAPDGTAVGLDPSPALLVVAREIAEQEGLADRVELRQGDVRALPVADADFDVVLAVTVLSHVPESERAVAELARVVRPGGRVGVFDIDGDSFVIAHPDRALTRRIVAAWSDNSLVDGWLGRRLPALMEEAGLTDVRVRAFTPVERGTTGFYVGLAERAAEVAVRAEAITVEEHRRWLETLRAEQAAGRFVAGLTHLFVWGARPLVMLVASDAEALAVEPTTIAEEPVIAVAPIEERVIPVAPVEVVER